MAIREIVKEGDPILRKVCREVTVFDAKLGRVLDDMLETMKRAEGVGLAAPQVGFMRRFAICEINDGEILEIINPVIVEKSGSQIGAEGCLSVPKVYKDVNRYMRITVKFLDRNGAPHTRELDGFNARVVQHEMDHLDGILFIDKAEKK